MNPEAWIAMIVGGAALFLNIVTLAIGYGVMRGTVAALGVRVKALEDEISVIGDLKVEVAKIGTRQETWIEQLRELNNSIRWMRDPAGWRQDPPGGKG